MHSKRRGRVEFLGSLNTSPLSFRIATFTWSSTILTPIKSASAGSRNTQRSISISPRPGRRVETWFSVLQGQSLIGASFTSVEQLQEHIDAFIAAYNETAVPFAWTKKKVAAFRFAPCGRLATIANPDTS
jgi:hypothetical protein